MRISKYVILIAVLILFLQPATAQDIEYISTQPWDHSPITVFIDEVNVPERYSPTYKEQVDIALEYWERGGNGKLFYTPVFEVVDDPDADIYIRWIENLEEVEGADEGVAGYAAPTFVGDKFLHVDIVLEVGNYQGFSWVQYGDANMQELAKHELGHALGLGHSSDQSDIMFPTYEQRDNLNPILLSRTLPYIAAISVVIISIIVYHTISWRVMKKRREEIEEEVFKR
ncbi:putative Zn-dependent protease [Methanohalophilus levihalophilus]|uniref:matrixin family metalloprotease n=1 Tax=Methanohalophilus levihalophilus TaxID=1431282 RepID=UPI001AE25B8F|nr:matrixin family metalloprotease [Methanohalophilus levihalophilus]MBP2030636.1 putative Zn-dependent protease [Methanohalophilus levihalophilus]